MNKTLKTFLVIHWNEVDLESVSNLLIKIHVFLKLNYDFTYEDRRNA